MMPPQALMEAVSANLQAGLNWFLQPIGRNLSKPQKTFLRDGLVPPTADSAQAGRSSAPWPIRRGGPDKPDFLLYRMLTGLTEAITARVYAGRALP